MADNARYTHVSPGVYTSETELTYAVKSLGLTSLGLVGETKKGPAFEPIAIENWRDFQNVFGGTSTEKFPGSQYPKYELPYIAKSYLSESNQLTVCRVLGMSGYNAGPAWVLKAKAAGSNNTEVEGMVIAVIRSRGQYHKYRKGQAQGDGTKCDCPSKEYDSLEYFVGEKEPKSCTEPRDYNSGAVQLDYYIDLSDSRQGCEDAYGLVPGSAGTGDFPATSSDYGRFKIKCWTGQTTAEQCTGTPDFSYPVTLNPSDNDYILKVLGTDPFNGEAPIYVESLYDVAFQQLVDGGQLSGVSKNLEFYEPYFTDDYCVLEDVADEVGELTEKQLSKKDVGKRFLATSENSGVTCHKYNYETNRMVESATMQTGQIYTVKQYTKEDGKREYYFAYYDENTITSLSGDAYYCAVDKLKEDSANTRAKIVMVNSYDRYARLVDGKVDYVTCDMNNYKEGFRFASTPWFVSDVKGDGNNIELKKLFRFHTISDGNEANKEVKVSIANIRPDEKQFDVYVRDINDTDGQMLTFETFTRCTLNPQDPNYIAYKIGSFDGVYESKSKYITVEVNETLATKNSVPCGFMGYPMTDFGGLQVAGEKHTGVSRPVIKYNTSIDQDIKAKRQYFGLSNLTGVDIDMFTYKGVETYDEDPDFVTQGFHLDSRVDKNSYKNYTSESSEVTPPVVTVEGVSGYVFDSVSVSERTNNLSETPIIASEADMEGCIFEQVNLRKFTAYFYGGFDGWDVYRDARTNTDAFKANKYQGAINVTNGKGTAFDVIKDAQSWGLNQTGITSDFYAYLAAARQFANPESVDINVFATPGIDLINNTMLSEEIIEMIEEERADSIYVAVTPDKPYGATDYVEDMYTPQEIVDELDNTDIDSNYTCTYYPWIKYEDKDNSKYIYLSPTKDVVRNMAITDNTTYPWFAPAGLSRGDVECVRAHMTTKLADEDTLYEGRINPIKTFASDGVKIWGQKNLQEGDAMLTRIAVRRLLLRMRKLVSVACLGLIFEPNDPTTKNKFLSLVTPIMDNIKANRGISDYRIEVNDTVESRMRRELPAKIYFKPYNALEYVILDFIVTPEAVSFDDI